MTRAIYSGPAAEQVWSGLRSYGCSSAFAIPHQSPVEVRVHISQVEQAERWLIEQGYRRAPRQTAAAQMGLGI